MGLQKMVKKSHKFLRCCFVVSFMRAFLSPGKDFLCLLFIMPIYFLQDLSMNYSLEEPLVQYLYLASILLGAP